MDRQTVVLRIAQKRQSKNISAYELSLRIGKSTGYMHMVEAGKVNISLDAIFAICKELEIEPYVLFKP